MHSYMNLIVLILAASAVSSVPVRLIENDRTIIDSVTHERVVAPSYWSDEEIYNYNIGHQVWDVM